MERLGRWLPAARALPRGFPRLDLPAGVEGEHAVPDEDAPDPKQTHNPYPGLPAGDRDQRHYATAPQLREGIESVRKNAAR